MNHLTQQHRAQQLLIRRAVAAQAARLWPALDWARLDETYPALAVRLAALVARFRDTSSGVAADYVQAFRASAGRRDRARVVFAEPVPAEQFHAVVHSTSVAAVKAAAGRGEPAESAMGSALTLTTGAVARLVLNGGRETLTATVAADPAADGWRRVLGGGGCDYCRERAGVRMTSHEVFEAHGGCGCTAEPIYT